MQILMAIGLLLGLTKKAKTQASLINPAFQYPDAALIDDDTAIAIDDNSYVSL